MIILILKPFYAIRCEELKNKAKNAMPERLEVRLIVEGSKCFFLCQHRVETLNGNRLQSLKQESCLADISSKLAALSLLLPRAGKNLGFLEFF